MVAIPLNLKIGNEYISVTSGESFYPKICNSIKSIKHKVDSLAGKYNQNVIEKANIAVTNSTTQNNVYTVQNRPKAVLYKGGKAWCKNSYALLIRPVTKKKKKQARNQTGYLFQA